MRFTRRITARLAAIVLTAAGGLAAPTLLATSAQAVTPLCSAGAVTAGTSPSCTATGTLTLTGGGLTATFPAALGWTGTLAGVDQDVVDTTHTSLEVDDLTGTGAGWHLTASATTFTGTTNATHTLPAGTLSFNGSADIHSPNTAPAATCVTTGKCTVPTNTTNKVTYPATVGTTSGVIFSADANTGLGKISVPTDWWVHIPAATYADTYTSTITLAVVSGP